MATVLRPGGALGRGEVILPLLEIRYLSIHTSHSDRAAIMWTGVCPLQRAPTDIHLSVNLYKLSYQPLDEKEDRGGMDGINTHRQYMHRR